jgi:hypothetical protein
MQVNMQNRSYGSALAAAAVLGQTDTVRFLVQEGADVNMPLQTGDYGSALAAAAHWGWKECVEILIDAGTKINLKLENGPYDTAIQASRADIPQEDRPWVGWCDKRDKEIRKRDKAEVAELLQRRGAKNDD